MKLATTLKAAAATLAIAGTVGGAQAMMIAGGITFDGGATLDSVEIEDATSVVAWDSTTVDQASGDFAAAGLADGSAATFSPGWTFGSGQPMLWTAGGFTFNLSASSITLQNNSFLLVEGTGFIVGNGFDQTAGTFSFSTQENDVNGRFSFSAAGVATPAGTNVPDGGATIALLGLSLLGLQGARKAIAKRKA